MEGEQGWTFNAPQYVDFSQINQLDDDNVEEYFEYDHENGGVRVQFEDESMDEGVTSNDIFSTPLTEVCRVTRAVSKTPLANGTPKSRITGSAKRVQRPKTPLGPASQNVATPEILPIKIVNSEVETVETLATPSPRVTRSGRTNTPNTVEKFAANLQKKNNGSVKKSEAVQDNTTAIKENKKNTQVESEKQAATANTQASNICSSLAEWRKKTAGAKVMSQAKSKTAQKEAEDKPKRQHRSLDRSKSFTRTKKPEITSTVSSSTNTASSNKGRTPNKGSNLQRARSFSSSSHDRSATNQTAASAAKKHTRGSSGDRGRTPSKTSDKPKTGGMTIPTTPVFMKRKPMKPAAAVKNSEEQELDKIAYYRQELAKKRRLAQESCKAALSGRAPTTALTAREPTKPEEFKFETDSRIKTHPMETRSDNDSVKDFASMLRSDKSSGKPQTSGPVKAGHLTKPEPFKLSTLRKRKLPDLEEKQAEKYETMAQKIANFTKTPERFRSKPRAGPSEEKRGRSRSPPPVTVPKTPQFETRTRTRPVSAPKREDLEKQEYEEAQRHQFKAHPVNHKILQGTSVGVKKVASKPVTVVEEFHLSSNVPVLDGAQARRNEEHYEFHAKPLNKKMLEGPVGVKEAKKMPMTVPESPAFALKHRARIPIVEETKETDRPNLRTRSVPHFGLPFQPQLQHRTTEPEPFGFEQRDRRRAEEKARKIEQIYEEEHKNREFHAQPLPDHEPHLPPKRARPLTIQKPFNLDTDTRGVKKTAEWNKKIEDEMHDLKEKSTFHARNPSVLDHGPFVPQKENKHTTDISEFELNTAKRLVKREAFETCKKMKQVELDNIRLQEERIRQTEQRVELERRRRDAVPRANPVKHYKPVAVRPSEKPVTMPMSPKFKTDVRLRTRSQHTDSFMSSNST